MVTADPGGRRGGRWKGREGGGPDDREGGRPDDREDDRERIRVQVRIIVEALGGPEVVGWAGGEDPADFQYLYRRGHILVPDSELDRVRRVLDGAEPADNLIAGVTLLRLPAGVDTLSALDRIDAALGAGVAAPDHVLHVTPRIGGCCPATEPEEPGTKSPLPGVSADEEDGRGVLVTVVDTGWHAPAESHPLTPWLAGVTGDAETINPAAIHPYGGHGTFVAGVVRCVAPAARVRVEGFLPKGGAVWESEIVVQLAQALRYAPDVISLSAGSHTRNGHPPLAFLALWESRLRHLKGTVLVAAAGNDGDRIPFWPAAFPWTVSVGALTASGDRAVFSNHGSWVDVYALGEDLVNAFPEGTFVANEPPDAGQVRTFAGLARWSGTSFSTPTVAGIIAARMSRTGESARVAADALLALARAGATPGVGAVLSPGVHNHA